MDSYCSASQSGGSFACLHRIVGNSLPHYALSFICGQKRYHFVRPLSRLGTRWAGFGGLVRKNRTQKTNLFLRTLHCLNGLDPRAFFTPYALMVTHCRFWPRWGCLQRDSYQFCVYQRISAARFSGIGHGCLQHGYGNGTHDVTTRLRLDS